MVCLVPKATSNFIHQKSLLGSYGLGWTIRENFTMTVGIYGKYVQYLICSLLQAVMTVIVSQLLMETAA